MHMKLKYHPTGIYSTPLKVKNKMTYIAKLSRQHLHGFSIGVTVNFKCLKLEISPRVLDFTP